MVLQNKKKNFLDFGSGMRHAFNVLPRPGNTTLMSFIFANNGLKLIKQPLRGNRGTNTTLVASH
jgi:hypothetical protein